MRSSRPGTGCSDPAPAGRPRARGGGRAPGVIAGSRPRPPVPGRARTRPVRARVRERPGSSPAAGRGRVFLGARERGPCGHGCASARVIAGSRPRPRVPGRARARPVRARVRERPGSSPAAKGARSLLGEREGAACEQVRQSAPGHRPSARASGLSRAARVPERGCTCWTLGNSSSARWPSYQRAPPRARHGVTAVPSSWTWRSWRCGRGTLDLDLAFVTVWSRYPRSGPGVRGGVVAVPSSWTWRSPRREHGTCDLDLALAGAWPRHLVPGRPCQAAPAGRSLGCAGGPFGPREASRQRASRPCRASRGFPAAGRPTPCGPRRAAACAPNGSTSATRESRKRCLL
jgi:hypothetical protein